ncbi:MAG: glycosyltransferase [Candidatus Aenigmatarchaeota archaeon]
MKIGIAWDFLVDKGGGEREVLLMAKILGADIITTQYMPERTYSDFSKINVISNPLKTFPIPLLMHKEASEKFKKIDLSDYDFLISIGDWAKFVSLNKTLRGRHIHITISPPRMFSDLRGDVEKNLGLFKRIFFKCWVYFAVRSDKKAMTEIEEVYVQSLEGRRRIENYYDRKVETIILYPPTEIKKFKSRKAGGYFLSVQRIMPQKNIETQIEAFNRMPDKRLIIAGSLIDNKKEYFNRLKASAKENIKFKINLTENELIELYSHANCAIQTSTREDFGLVPVEAMASGKPCIAVNEGGFMETITNDTGVLINKPYVENLIEVVKGFKISKYKRSAMLKRANMFSDEVFEKKLSKIIFSGV